MSLKSVNNFVYVYLCLHACVSADVCIENFMKLIVEAHRKGPNSKLKIHNRDEKDSFDLN